jgi:hypothetical protein
MNRRESSCVITDGSDEASNDEEEDDIGNIIRYRQYSAVLGDDEAEEEAEHVQKSAVLGENSGGPISNDPEHVHYSALLDKHKGKDSGSTQEPRELLQKKRTHAAAASSSPSSTPYVPPTSSTPVTNYFDAVLECLDLLRVMRADASVDKEDVIQSLQSMLHNMLSTVMMNNFTTSMSVQGWKVE